MTLDQLCGAIKSLKHGQLWRHNQAGDLPGAAGRKLEGYPDSIDNNALGAIVQANKGKRGFTYTHYPWANEDAWPDRENLSNIRKANHHGFTINVSCETAAQVDKAVSLGLPAVITVPSDAPNTWHTPAGNLVKTCPAVLYDNVTCASCGLCQKQTLVGPKGETRPRHTVAFPAHGTAFKKLSMELRTIQ